MNQKIKQALDASDQVSSNLLEIQKVLTELLGDMQEMNHALVEALDEKQEK